MDDQWIPIILFLSTAAAVIGYLHFNSQNKRAKQASLQAAIQRGDVLTPEMIAAIGSERSASATDFRRGALLIALAVGIAIFGQFVGPDKTELLGIAMIPGMLGVGYLFVWRFGPKN